MCVYIYIHIHIYGGFPGCSAGKQSTYNAGDPGLIPAMGSPPEEGIGYLLQYSWASLVAQLVKKCLQRGRHEFDPWVGKIPWMRAWQPTPVFLPGESHGQRSLIGYSPKGRQDSNTTEAKERGGTSLEVQWLRLCLQMQGVWV